MCLTGSHRDPRLTKQLIHEWKNTLCIHSKYKEDLVHIRDMHRLLSYKGGSQQSSIRFFADLQATDSSHLTQHEPYQRKIPMK